MARTAYETVLASRRRVYGTDGVDLLREQNYACAICGVSLRSPENPVGKAQGCLDHCHGTGIVRGWLCYSCNHGLSRFKEDQCLLTKAAAYLGMVSIFE